MKNVISAKTAIDAEIGSLENRLKICKTIKEELEKLAVDEEIETENPITDESVNLFKINPEQFKDYPFSKRLFEKLKYLDDKFPRAWKMNNRVELIVQIEGEASRVRLKNMSQDLKMLVNAGLYIGAKFNGENKSQFYCRPEWITDDGKAIKPEYAPTDEDFGTMPVFKRKNELIH